MTWHHKPWLVSLISHKALPFKFVLDSRATVIIANKLHVWYLFAVCVAFMCMDLLHSIRSSGAGKDVDIS